MTIFDLMQPNELAAYWTEFVKDEAPYPAEELFPDNKKMGLDLKWLKGAKGLPVVLKTSAFDAFAVPRPRIGFDRLTAQMPYFKESSYIDEELRQELNIVLETGNQAYIDSVMTKIFDDETRLLRGARASRERMRMMALTTGVISMTANGQNFSFDYSIPSDNKADSAVKWSLIDKADPIADIRSLKEKVESNTGATLTRAMCDGTTWSNLRNNKKIKQAIFVLTSGTGELSDVQLKNYLAEQLDGLEVVVNKKRYINETGTSTPFMPATTFVMFPDGNLGTTWFGTTPAESDLMASQVANVSIVDTGVAITGVQKADPVNVETIVSMICLPSFEAADEVGIIDTSVGTGGD